MALKQRSLTIHENPLKALKEYSKEFGYRNIQEFTLELIRRKIFYEQLERYQKIERDMALSKKVKKYSQKEAVEYLKNTQNQSA